MSTPMKRSPKNIAKFDPTKTKQRDSEAKAVIEHAERVKDWPLLKRAIEEKVEEQGEFDQWWGACVRGKGQKRNNHDLRYFVSDAEKLTGIKQQQVSRWHKKLKDPEKYKADLYDAAYRRAMAETSDVHVAHNSGENEWYTPAEYVEAARSVLVRIDLDPASSETANQIIKAVEIFTLLDDGLGREWNGTVWMNPPYTAGLVDKFCAKLVKHYQAGDVPAAIVLLNNTTETECFQSTARAATAICFHARRIRFWAPDRTTRQPLQGQAFLYFGTSLQRFKDAFDSFGFVVEVRK